MKKCILSPMCSAIVVPGLGQIINRNMGKGLILLALVFLLFVAGTVRLVFIIKSMVNQPVPVPRDADGVLNMVRLQDYSSLIWLGLAFALVWVYSVADAFWTGRRMDRMEKEDSR